MAISRQQVIQIAELAKLSLNEEEIAQYAGQLSAVLEYAARLDELDTANIPPTATVLPAQNIMRDDVVRKSLGHAEIFANAPDHIENQFRVNAVLE
jgi:aspartyl-tRNA(Asn)/glutamyl-tRNA(Gln) amidotransferase subunit C